MIPLLGAVAFGCSMAVTFGIHKWFVDDTLRRHGTAMEENVRP